MPGSHSKKDKLKKKLGKIGKASKKKTGFTEDDILKSYDTKYTEFE